MKAQTLICKLNKMEIPGFIKEVNDYNKELIFDINGKKYSADFNENVNNQILSFSIITGYDDVNQESTRRFFKTLDQVLKHSEN